MIGIIGVIFGVYHYFKNPQVDQDKRQAVLETEIKWDRDANAKKFTEMKDSIKAVEDKVDGLVELENDMNLRLVTQITELATKLDEREGRVG